MNNISFDILLRSSDTMLHNRSYFILLVLSNAPKNSRLNLFLSNLQVLSKIIHGYQQYYNLTPYFTLSSVTSIESTNKFNSKYELNCTILDSSSNYPSYICWSAVDGGVQSIWNGLILFLFAHNIFLHRIHLIVSSRNLLAITMYLLFIGHLLLISPVFIELDVNESMLLLWAIFVNWLVRRSVWVWY